MDLFELLGISPEEKKDEKKEKKAVKKEVKKVTKQVVEMVMLPISVVTGYIEPVTYTEEDFEGKKEISLIEVAKKFANDYPAFAPNMSRAKKTDSCVIIVQSVDIAVQKGQLYNIDKDTRMIWGKEMLDLSAFMTSDSCTLEVADIITGIHEEYPDYGNIGLIHCNNIVAPVVIEKNIAHTIHTPATISIWGRGMVTIEENENEDEGDEISIEEAKKLVQKNYPDITPDIIDIIYVDESKYAVVMKQIENGLKTANTTKTKTYPTDAEVSIYAMNKFSLTPEYFDGKTVISENELIDFIETRYPEFSKERTYILYDEKKKLIMPCLKSSSKGSSNIEIVYTDEQEKDKIFPFIRCYDDGSKYRVEKTPVAEYRVAIDGTTLHNDFKFIIPKIPYSIFRALTFFFRKVYFLYETEVMVQILYSPEEGYIVNLPFQKVTEATVEVERDHYVEHKYLLVADVHSHGAFPAFFSSTDDADEKGTRIYGVYGNFLSAVNNSEKKFRIGCGGYFFDIGIEDICDMSNNDDRDVSFIWNNLFDQVEEKITVVRR